MTVPEGSIANKVCSKPISNREYQTAILLSLAYLYLNIYKFLCNSLLLSVKIFI